MNFKDQKPPIVKIFAAMLMLFLSAASFSAQTEPGKAYSQTLAKHVRLMNEQLRTVSDYKKYFVKASALWRKLSDADRLKIVEDWWRRWRKISKPDDAMNELQSLDGKKDVYCSLAENGVDPGLHCELEND